MKTNCNDCCYPPMVNPESCGCCEGVEVITPLSTYNRPGLSEINYRIGSHASFLETMTARLTGYYLEKPDAKGNPQKVYPLKGLTTRESDDPALAMLDAWAIVADVLTFYQERIANEGYLRTATERRSILEIARLVGYKPRPGVSSSVFLAYTLDENFEEETIIPAGSRSQSIPGPDELPQSFETSEDLKARTQWNNLKPRMTKQSILNKTEVTINGTTESKEKPRVYLKGINTNLKINDPLLIVLGTGTPDFYWVKEVLPDTKSDHTLVTLYNAENEISKFTPEFKVIPLVEMIRNLTIPASIQPVNPLWLRQNLASQFGVDKRSQSSGMADISMTNFSNPMPFGVASQPGFMTLGAFSPILEEKFASAVKNLQLSENQIKVYALRTKASLFGHNAPKEPQYNTDTGALLPQQSWSEWKPDIGNPDSDSIDESRNILYLDKSYQEILSGDFIALQRIENNTDPEVFIVQNTQTISRQAYGISGETSRIEIDSSWWEPPPRVTRALTVDQDISKIRTTKVFAHPEFLELAEEPITSAVCVSKDKEDIIELDGFYDGLEAGRWVIVSGERKELSGVRFSELAMLSSVTQAGIEKAHTFIQLAEKIAYCFKRDTVTINANVVKATHGETRHEVLGSGNGGKSFQTFELKQFPLTYISASNPKGIDSTLKLFVNDIQWHEADSLAGLDAKDRQFITKTDNDDKTTVIFGNGKKGARLPTGIENIKATYRSGIGKSGNVKAAQISMVMDKPLGVKDIINPLQASGGANRETRDQERQHLPLAVKALDRLVSVQDYEDFSRIYAGIGKAHAVELSNGRQQLVHITIAGAEDIPIAQSSDLFRNLRTALHHFGDPQQVIQLAIRELMFIVIEAEVAILPDYQWESVVTNIRERLLEVFSFEQRELGQDVMLSEVISAMQSVHGVAYIDVDSFGGIPEKVTASYNFVEEHGESRRLLTPDEIAIKVGEIVLDKDRRSLGSEQNTSYLSQRLRVDLADNNRVIPAQIAFLTPDVPATLILNQIERLA